MAEQSLSEILIGFFKFYLETFDPCKHAISISHPEGSLISRESYKQEIKRAFADSEIVREDLLNKYDKWTFIIVDTFDRTINVGRAIKRKGHIEKWYF
jgi:Cid1 family poly A polymerase